MSNVLNNLENILSNGEDKRCFSVFVKFITLKVKVKYGLLLDAPRKEVTHNIGASCSDFKPCPVPSFRDVIRLKSK